MQTKAFFFNDINTKRHIINVPILKITIGAIPGVGGPDCCGQSRFCQESDEFLVAVLGSLGQFFLDADELVVLGHAVGA